MITTPSRWTRPHLRRLGSFVALAGLGVTAAACSGGGGDAAPTTAATTTEAPTTTVERTTTTARATTTTTTTTTEAPTTTTTTEKRYRRMPLTGAVLGEGKNAPDHPALVVKIDNNPVARPQSGLNSTDIVFEEIVEVGTRFAAVFHSSGANPVGPIRSGRTQDVDLLGGLRQPLFAWSGGNGGVTRAIADSDLTDLNWQTHGGLYRRQGGNPTPHNLYSTTDELFAQAAPDAARPKPVFTYLDPDEKPRGKTVSSATVRMDTDSVLWEWSPEIKGFLRTTNGNVQIDANTGERLRTTNVVILLTPYRPSYVDARSPEAITIGGGKLVVLSGGRMITGNWLRDARDRPFALFDDKGRAIELLPGRTWVELADPVTYDLQTT